MSAVTGNHLIFLYWIVDLLLVNLMNSVRHVVFCLIVSSHSVVDFLYVTGCVTSGPFGVILIIDGFNSHHPNRIATFWIWFACFDMDVSFGLAVKSGLHVIIEILFGDGLWNTLKKWMYFKTVDRLNGYEKRKDVQSVEVILDQQFCEEIHSLHMTTSVLWIISSLNSSLHVCQQCYVDSYYLVGVFPSFGGFDSCYHMWSSASSYHWSLPLSLCI